MQKKKTSLLSVLWGTKVKHFLEQQKNICEKLQVPPGFYFFRKDRKVIFLPFTLYFLLFTFSL